MTDYIPIRLDGELLWAAWATASDVVSQQLYPTRAEARERFEAAGGCEGAAGDCRVVEAVAEDRTRGEYDVCHTHRCLVGANDWLVEAYGAT